MEIDEGEAEGSEYSSLVVDPSEVQDLSVSLDEDEENEDSEPQPGGSGSQPRPKGNLRKVPDLYPISEHQQPMFTQIDRLESAGPSTSASGRRPRTVSNSSAIDPDEEIRKATSRYLQGYIVLLFVLIC